jgi:hypothetical protein
MPIAAIARKARPRYLAKQRSRRRNVLKAAHPGNRLRGSRQGH